MAKEIEMGEFKPYNQFEEDSSDIEKIKKHLGSVSRGKKTSAESLYSYVLTYAYKNQDTLSTEEFIEKILKIIGESEPDVIMEFLHRYLKNINIRIKLSDFVLSIEPKIIKPAINVFVDYLRFAFEDNISDEDIILGNFLRIDDKNGYSDFLEHFKENKNSLIPNTTIIKKKERIDPNIRTDLETVEISRSDEKYQEDHKADVQVFLTIF